MFIVKYLCPCDKINSTNDCLIHIPTHVYTLHSSTHSNLIKHILQYILLYCKVITMYAQYLCPCDEIYFTSDYLIININNSLIIVNLLHCIFNIYVLVMNLLKLNLINQLKL